MLYYKQACRQNSRISTGFFWAWLFALISCTDLFGLMTTVRDRINAHLPIVLEVLRTGSLIVIALSTICASQSLKQMAGSHELPSEASQMHKSND